MSGHRPRATFALLLLVGCVRTNAAFGEDAASTGGPGSTSSSDATTQSTNPTDDPSTPETTGGNPTDPVLDVGEPDTTDGDSLCEVPLSGCSTFLQDCGEGKACRPTLGAQGEGTRCVIPGDEPIDAECEPLCNFADGIDTCKGAGFCDVFSDDPTCIQLCGGTVEEPECPKGRTCLRRFIGDDIVGLCRTSCRPLNPEECEQDEACIVTRQGAVCAPVDEALFPAAHGAPCSDAGLCGFGFVCIDGGRVEGCPDENGQCCAEQCDTMDPSACSDFADSSCVSYNELEGLGIGPFDASFGGCALPS
ncbi:MAG: hypothetical protein AAGA54_17240 [Myxococcota bacterium]